MMQVAKIPITCHSQDHHGNESSRSSSRILVVEDNLVNQEVAAFMLARLGLDTLVVCNGKQAVEACKKESFIAVLMDIQMPEMDGLQATQLIRAQQEPSHVTDKRMPIIAVTANGTTGHRETCLSSGMDDFLLKPMRMPELASILAKHLGYQSITTSSAYKSTSLTNPQRLAVMSNTIAGKLSSIDKRC